MSGTFPTSPAPSSVTVKSMYPTRVSTTQSLKIITRSLGVQRWSIEAQWDALTRASWAPFLAFLISQRGQFDTFTFTNVLFPRGTYPGTPLVNGALAAGVSTAALDGFTAGQTGVAMAGDYVKFNGHSKVYMVTADANSNGSGQVAAFTFEPKLTTTVADNEPLVWSSVPFNMGLVSDNLSLPIGRSMMGSLQLEFIERV